MCIHCDGEAQAAMETPGYWKSTDVQGLSRASPRERPQVAMATEPEVWLSQPELLDMELQGLVFALLLF